MKTFFDTNGVVNCIQVNYVASFDAFETRLNKCMVFVSVDIFTKLHASQFLCVKTRKELETCWTLWTRQLYTYLLVNYVLYIIFFNTVITSVL